VTSPTNGGGGGGIVHSARTWNINGQLLTVSASGCELGDGLVFNSGHRLGPDVHAVASPSGGTFDAADFRAWPTVTLTEPTRIDTNGWPCFVEEPPETFPDDAPFVTLTGPTRIVWDIPGSK
jgi:hypothetical protein